MIELEKIKFKNIGSYGNAYTVLQLNSHKKTLSLGVNGSGKSLWLSAITYALYDRPFTKIKKGKLINSINKSNMEVVLDFKSDNTSYKIIRGMKPNIFEIYENGKLLNQDAKSKDYQEYLESNILKMSFKTFTQVCILGSARYTSFMELPAADRREVIEDLLDIQIFSTMNQIVKDKQSIIKSDINELKNKIQSTEDKLDIYKTTLQEKEKYSEEKILHFKNEIIQYNTKKEHLSSNNDLLLNKIDQLNNQIADKSKTEQKNIKLIEIKSKLSSNLEKIVKDQDFFGSHDSCPLCKQDIDLDHKQGVILDGNEKKFALMEGLDKVKDDLIKNKSKLDDISKITDRINQCSNLLIRNKTEISSIDNYVQKLQDEIDSIHNENKIIDKEKIKSLIKDLKRYNKEYQDVLDSKKHYDYVSLLLKDGGVKTQIIKQYLPLLNKYINKYLEKMNFFVNFNIDENFEEVIKSRYRDEFSFANFSEGEKVRINLCLLFAFRQLAKLKNSVNINILFFDEIIDGASDEEGIQGFLNLLDEVDSNIFVISHRTDNIIDRFDRVIEISKVKNFSRMKELK